MSAMGRDLFSTTRLDKYSRLRYLVLVRRDHHHDRCISTTHRAANACSVDSLRVKAGRALSSASSQYEPVLEHVQ